MPHEWEWVCQVSLSVSTSGWCMMLRLRVIASQKGKVRWESIHFVSRTYTQLRESCSLSTRRPLGYHRLKVILQPITLRDARRVSRSLIHSPTWSRRFGVNYHCISSFCWWRPSGSQVFPTYMVVRVSHYTQPAAYCPPTPLCFEEDTSYCK